MMKKPFKFSELNLIFDCVICKKPLKLNVTTHGKDFNICYSCYRKHKAKKPMTTAREVRTGKKPGREKGIYHIK
jgi:hypothetical protein